MQLLIEISNGWCNILLHTFGFFIIAAIVLQLLRNQIPKLAEGRRCKREALEAGLPQTAETFMMQSHETFTKSIIS